MTTHMLELLASNPLAFAVIFPGLLLSIAIHEFAHAWSADALGDPTPRAQGRVTLNPLSHLDPLGTVAILITHFGWGKPVQFDPYNLRHPARDGALIALAGPVTNLLIALVLAVVLRLGLLPFSWFEAGIFQVLVINVVLAIFNLVPVYPLDGSKIFLALLPNDLAHEYDRFMQQFGMFVLIALIVPWNGVSPVSSLIWPVITAIVNLLV